MHQGEWEIILLITAELAFLCINRSMPGYKDMPELKIEENQSLVLSFTYTWARRAKMFICHSVAHRYTSALWAALHGSQTTPHSSLGEWGVWRCRAQVSKPIQILQLNPMVTIPPFHAHHHLQDSSYLQFTGSAVCQATLAWCGRGPRQDPAIDACPHPTRIPSNLKQTGTVEVPLQWSMLRSFNQTISHGSKCRLHFQMQPGEVTNSWLVSQKAAFSDLCLTEHFNKLLGIHNP